MIDHNDLTKEHLPPKSWFSPKTVIADSKIQGKGLTAIADIMRDEIIGIKDGYIFDKNLFKKIGGWHSLVGQAQLQIADDFFLGPRMESEIPLSMMYANHSCDGNIGFLGNCIVVAMRDIKAGEELSSDYATWLTDPEYRLDCKCGKETCRKTITGNDWQITELQQKYRGYFSAYIEKKLEKVKV
jgi:hypothetical protein